MKKYPYASPQRLLVLEYLRIKGWEALHEKYAQFLLEPKAILTFSNKLDPKALAKFKKEWEKVTREVGQLIIPEISGDEKGEWISFKSN